MAPTENHGEFTHVRVGKAAAEARPTVEGGLERAYTHAAEAAQRVDDLVAQLRTRLEPVLTLDEPRTLTERDPGDGPTSPHTEALHGLALRLHETGDRVSSLLRLLVV